MKNMTSTEAKKIFQQMIAEKRRKAEYFQAHGTLKGFVTVK